MRGIERGRWLIPALVLTLVVAGCRGEHASGVADEDVHGGHVAPAHKPKDFPQAVRKLRELERAVDVAIAGGRWKALVDDRTLPIALDVATWLPEIAADSDMPEEPWDVVNGQSGVLVAAYKNLLKRANGAGASGEELDAKKADRSIAELEGLLARSDPRWFEAVVRHDGQPR